MEQPIQAPPAELIEAAAYIENELDRRLSASDLPHSLYEATRYAVVNGGKRVRPALTLLCAEAVGGTQEDAMPAAVALEYIHCFSLIHDDLPAIDNDDLRRGKPTLHIHAGEAMALLSGDFLLPLAFLQLSEAQYQTDQKLLLIEALSTATKNMVVGQVYDTLGQLPEQLCAESGVEEIHRKKTGSLIRCACVMGGICGNATPEQQEAIEKFGDATGLMFQIVDDLIDMHGTTEHIGKQTGKDATAGKITYPSTIGVERSIEEIETLKEQADSALRTLGKQGETLRTFNLWMAQRTR